MKTIQQAYREQIDMFTEDVTKMVTHRFSEDKFIAPVAMALIMKDDKLSIAILGGLGELFTSDEGKEQAAEVMKQLNQELKPVAFAFATEGYASIHDQEKDISEILDEEGRMKVKPSEDPNAKEVLMISFETHDQQLMKLYEINRENGDPVLEAHVSDEKWMDKGSQFAGRMSNLLEENYSELAELLRKQLGHQLN